jgi:hypothetical protein
LDEKYALEEIEAKYAQWENLLRAAVHPQKITRGEVKFSCQ